MLTNNLHEIAKQMVAPGKGIFATDAHGSLEKRMAKHNVAFTPETRLAFRKMMYTTPGLGAYVSGVIMNNESVRVPELVSALVSQGILPGIKVDEGPAPMQGSPNEKIVKGLDGLSQRFQEYVGFGAKFAKWRAIITIGEGTPTEANIAQQAKDLASYAHMAQEAGLAPIVEPETLMDGSHTQARCAEITEHVLKTVFSELKAAEINYAGMILKPNMVVSGKESGEKITSEQVAKMTLKVLKSVVPTEVPGIAFLSGGLSELDATANLNAINKIGGAPWRLTFSFERALQGSTLETWSGKDENVSAAQQKLLHRAKMNSLASMGKYSSDLELIT